MKIAVYDLEGHLLEVIQGESIRDISNELKLGSEIYQCLKGQTNFSGNRQYREVFNDKPILKVGNVLHCGVGTTYNPIHKFYKGKYICTYDNITEASNKTKILHGAIRNCLSGKTKSAGGFNWIKAIDINTLKDE